MAGAARIVALVALASMGSRAQSADAAIQLPERLTLRDAQSGVAGESGTILTIERDGRFRVARLLNARVEPPHSKGSLGPLARRKLARVMNEVASTGLPAMLGDRSQANPRRLGLAIGEQGSTLTLPAGQSPQAAASSSQAQGFLKLWTTAHDLVAQAQKRQAFRRR